MSAVKTTLIALIALAAVLAYSSIFTVDEREVAIKFRLGEIISADYEPGIHFKLPFINNVRKFDKRVMTIDAVPDTYLTQEQKNVVVDYFVKWRISDPTTFYTTMSGNEATAANRIMAIVNDGLRAEFSNRTVQEVVSGERVVIMDTITERASRQVQRLGVRIVDVRVKRIDLPRDVSASVYQRMEAERARVAKDFRARGQEAAERIRADADRQHTLLIADAYRQGQEIRAQGDARSAAIYAAAYEKDAEFYAFYRSLEAYRKTFANDDGLLVLQPDSEFFQYFGRSGTASPTQSASGR